MNNLRSLTDPRDGQSPTQGSRRTIQAVLPSITLHSGSARRSANLQSAPHRHLTESEARG